MKGKCNCGNKATSTWLIRDGKAVREIAFCDDCIPRYRYNLNQMIRL